MLCQTASPVQLFCTCLFNICNTKSDGGENDIYFNNLNDIILTTSKNLRLQMQASVVVLARAKNIVGHMPILHGIFRSARISFPQVVWELGGAEVGMRNAAEISKCKSRAQREMSLFLWDPGA